MRHEIVKACLDFEQRVEAARAEQALQRRGRAVDGKRELLSHDRHGKVHVADAAQDARQEIAIVEARRVPAVRHFVVGRAVDVVEDRS